LKGRELMRPSVPAALILSKTQPDKRELAIAARTLIALGGKKRGGQRSNKDQTAFRLEIENAGISMGRKEMHERTNLKERRSQKKVGPSSAASVRKKSGKVGTRVT